MSRFIGTGTGFSYNIWTPEGDMWRDGCMPRFNNAQADIEWKNLWPSSRSCGLNGANGDAFQGQDASSYSGWFEFPFSIMYSGTAAGLCLDGITRDSSSAALGICVVECFLTSTDVLVTTCTSGPTGEYVIITPYNANHYLKAYKAGGTDVAGTTVNTLTPSSTRTY